MESVNHLALWAMSEGAMAPLYRRTGAQKKSKRGSPIIARCSVQSDSVSERTCRKEFSTAQRSHETPPNHPQPTSRHVYGEHPTELGSIPIASTDASVALRSRLHPSNAPDPCDSPIL